MTSQHLPEGYTSVTTVMGNGNMGLFLKDSRVLNVTRKYWKALHSLRVTFSILIYYNFFVFFLMISTDAPIVSLSLGAPLDPNNLLKGSDVFLDCEVRANPAITKIEWYHNVSRNK